VATFSHPTKGEKLSGIAQECVRPSIQCLTLRRTTLDRGQRRDRRGSAAVGGGRGGKRISDCACWKARTDSGRRPFGGGYVYGQRHVGAEEV